MFCDTYTKGHKAPLRHFPANYFVNNDLPCCTLRSARFIYIQIYRQRQNSFPEKWCSVFFLLLDICVIGIFLTFLSEILGSQNRSQD